LDRIYRINKIKTQIRVLSFNPVNHFNPV